MDGIAGTLLKVPHTHAHQQEDLNMIYFKTGFNNRNRTDGAEQNTN